MRCSVSSADETLTEKRVENLTCIFGELQGVSCGDETLLNAWYLFSNKMIFEGEIKNAKNEQIFIWLH